jgi:hypothetical protein
MVGLPDWSTTDLARLRRERSTGAVILAEDDSGTYLQAHEFETSTCSSMANRAVGRAACLSVSRSAPVCRFAGHGRAGRSYGRGGWSMRFESARRCREERAR